MLEQLDAVSTRMAAINNNLPGKAVMVVNAGERSNPPYGFRYREGAQKDWDNMCSVLNDLGFERLNKERERSYNVSLSRWDHTKTRDGVGHAQGNTHPPHAENPPSETCCLKCLIQHHDFGLASSFAFYISTHGVQERGVLSVQFLSDYENTYDSITVKEIVQTMSSNPTLKAIPKILIVQACREDDMHLGSGHKV
ncbi:hypothetical protein MAR_009605 [Mya arenaria]|uniref:Caspase family p20 domain-containing protein n=1 Tax=Mya arenaria TaxID=6604 RepID=A0ABY7E279_MYAAR|nr:hypothetical protein MAR_009605 [Mya arenaria]